MPPLLSSCPDGESVVFTAVGAPSWTPGGDRETTLVLEDGRPARTGCLVVLLDDGQAKLEGPNAVRVPAEYVARLSGRELAGLGLPPRAPFSLTLEPSRHIVTSPQFAPTYRLLLRGLPQVVVRHGCFVEAGGARFTLPESLYRPIVALDAFADNRSDDPAERMLAWAHIRDELPRGALDDGYLRGMQVVAPSAVGLRPFVDDEGKASFVPVLLVPETRPAEEPGGEARVERVPALSEDAAIRFERQFGRQAKVRSQFSLGHGTYAVISPDLQQIMTVLQRYARADVKERRGFLLQAREVLHAELPDLDVEALDALFMDDGLSDRVRGLGIWEQRSVPQLDAADAEGWLPSGDPGLGEDDSNDEPSKPSAESLAPPKGSVDKIVLITEDNVESVGHLVERDLRAGELKTLPTRLCSELYPHQQAALQWLQEHWISGSPGALLADDMGLGKTLEVLAFLVWLRELMDGGKLPHGPMLVVAPTGLLANWENEHAVHTRAPGVGRLLRAYGRELKGLRIVRTVTEFVVGQPVLDTERLRGAGWVLTTYETLRDYQHSFGRVQWVAIAYDETQKIKNPVAAMTEAAKAMNAEFQIALTGTPVENRLADLWCIVDTVRAGWLGSLNDFCRTYEKVADPAAAASELSRTLAEDDPPPAMLRRLKQDHLQGLPALRVHRHIASMPPEQASAYEDVVRQARGDMAVLEALGQLRNVSLHPRVYDGGNPHEYIRQSARLAACFDVLDDVHARGEKALVFIESRQMQAALVEILPTRFGMSSAPMVVNGAVPGRVRQARVDMFQSSPGFDVMLVSPKAGGVGLTLTAANHVIHLSRWWNPAVEDQCTDRVYRIGQTREVQVHLVLAEHPGYGQRSFDHKLDALLERKRSLSRAALAPVAFTGDDAGALLDDVVST